MCSKRIINQENILYTQFHLKHWKYRNKIIITLKSNASQLKAAVIYCKYRITQSGNFSREKLKFNDHSEQLSEELTLIYSGDWRSL